MSGVECHVVCTVSIYTCNTDRCIHKNKYSLVVTITSLYTKQYQCMYYYLTFHVCDVPVGNIGDCVIQVIVSDGEMGWGCYQFVETLYIYIIIVVLMLENLELLPGFSSSSVVSLVTIWPATHPGKVFDHACFTMTPYKGILLWPYNHAWTPSSFGRMVDHFSGWSKLSLTMRLTSLVPYFWDPRTLH